jgi:hypothetical protein|tara:strand:- start:707 stop:916 length:210 start_codon:yes stop_codon:yes gene_type:complete
MLSKNEEMTAALMCTVALLLGLLIVVLTGCDRIIESQHEPHFDAVTPQNRYEMHDLTYPSNEYDIENVT